MAMKTRRQKSGFIRFITILAGNLLLLLVLLGLVEAYCRFAGIPYRVTWTPTETAVARFDDELGWSYLPNCSKTQSSPNYSIQVHFDQDGIRVPSPDVQFDYSRPSVLFIGGSFTMGHGLSYEESFVGQFAARPDMPYQVVNLGVQGYGSDQSLLTLKKFFPKFKTKIVVYTFMWGHITRNGNYDRRLLHPDAKFLGTKPLFRLNRRKELYLARTPLRYEEYLKSWLLDALTIKVGNRLGWFPPFPEDLTSAIIQEMKTYCEAHQAHFVVLNWRWVRSSYNALFEELEGVEVIDTLHHAPADWNARRIPGDGHPDARAGERVSRILYEYMLERKWFEAPSENSQ
jgi:hypothetical protein